MTYIQFGINWVFPYKVEYEDECICILKSLPRIRREQIKDIKDGTEEISIYGPFAFIKNEKKLVEVHS